jgi:hypothetical protein
MDSIIGTAKNRIKQMALAKIVSFLACVGALIPALARGGDDVVAGPLYSKFPLTLAPGQRQEAVGPLYYEQDSGAQHQWAFPPVCCFTVDPEVGWKELDLLYPVIDYRNFGSEYRFQIFQLFSISGGQNQGDQTNHLFTLFPLYFQRRSSNPASNYTALLPFYGHLENRMFHDDIKFVMFPLYAKTENKGVVTWNFPYPFFDVHEGERLHGWQFWPLVGAEYKFPTKKINYAGDEVIVGGHDKLFVLWPFFFKDWFGLGTENPQRTLTVIPFYNAMHSALRDQVSYGWPLGYNVIDDRENKYQERDVLWPFFVFAEGSKTEKRIFPFYSRARSERQETNSEFSFEGLFGGEMAPAEVRPASVESDFYMWPVYKFNRISAPPLERERTRIFLFLYSDITQKNVDAGATTLRRVDFWPFYTYRRDAEGNRRLQAPALLEPFFPNNRAMAREYSQLWSFWRSEKNSKTGAASQSLLWNLCRQETVGESKKLSLFFGLFQYQSSRNGAKLTVCFIPVEKKAPTTTAPSH